MKFFRTFLTLLTTTGVLISAFGPLGVQPAYAASIVVNDPSDTLHSPGCATTGMGTCSLRDAITFANSDPGADTITFDANYTITLSSQLPDVATEITITGNGAANTTIQANAAPDTATFRVFLNTSSGNLTLENLTVQNGRAIDDVGGGIHNSGTLTIRNSAVTQNMTFASSLILIPLPPLHGGGIYNSGILLIEDSNITKNNLAGWVLIGVGGLPVPGLTVGNFGSGIYNSGALTIQGTTISENKGAGIGDLASGIYNVGFLTIDNSTISGNVANGVPSGIFNDTTNSVTLTNVIISDNIGGGIYSSGNPMLTNMTFSGNTGKGGMISSGNPTLTNVTFSGNTASSVDIGGGMSISGGGSLTDVTFSDNQNLTGAGGLFVGSGASPILKNVTFSNNRGGTGGGMLSYESNPVLTNVTFSGNSASIGGGMTNMNGSPTLTNVTFKDNSANEPTIPDGGGGLANLNLPSLAASSGATLINVIITNSVGDNCATLVATFPFPLNAASKNNLIDDTTCGLTDGVDGNLIGATHIANLGALQNNGGLTQTIALGANSDAIDAGNPASCPTTDQRGVARPQGSACDIGAYELDATLPTVTVEQASGQTDPTSASPINFTATFSEAINISTFDAADITLDGTAPGTLTAIITEISPNDGTTFNIAVSGMTGSGTVTSSIDAGKVQDLGGNTNATSTSVDNEVTYDNAFPVVAATSLQASYTGTGPNSFTITFSKEVSNAGGGAGADDVTNANNYKIINKGANGTVETATCASPVSGDDTLITPASVIYTNPTAVVNLGVALPVGSYRLFVCGTTSIVDLAGNALAGDGTNSGTDYTFDFTVGATVTTPATTTATRASSLPATGFAPKTVTTLPPQPANLQYANVGDIVLEIPSLNVKSSIVGVPQSQDKTWDVTWLGDSTGWLNGTAFPTWNGNSVLTAHVTNASGLDGPFAALKSLKYGDQVIIHFGGVMYVYEVRNTKLARPYSTSFAFESKQDHAYLTLITCQGYNPLNESYLFRRVVRAVLVDVK